MDNAHLKKFAQAARKQLLKQVAARVEQVLVTDSSARREHEKAVRELEQRIAKTSKETVIEEAAYTWFNRFCALRFMDVNNYTRIGTISPQTGFTQPEILQEAKQGHISDEFTSFLKPQKVFDLLSGQLPSADPQQEAYRILLVAVCNRYFDLMPFMFAKIDDFTELLMPDDLLSENSILRNIKEAINSNGEEKLEVEIIGWLYQFYISEKKDEVFADLKKNKKKIMPENIPAATQLFTPHWIVKYLVENSLGRLWMLNHPDSGLIDKMEYYIKPEQAETDFLRISSPEEIKICDPACGSGHMLTYAFDLLHAIYDEEGYETAQIPQKILTHNLYGIEIDKRAGALAAFALFMKAREKSRRFFRKPVQPNICVLENIGVDENDLKAYLDEIGADLFTHDFTANLKTLLQQFTEADNFGSLIRPAITDVGNAVKILEEKGIGDKLLFYDTHQQVRKALVQADYLSPKYHVVIANPPYMGGKGMNGRLGAWAKNNYPDSKSDLFAMFIERNLDLAQKQGSVAMITMQSWMFLSSFEKLRNRLLDKNTILSMAHLGARAFDSIGGEVVSTTAFVLGNSNLLEFKGGYLRLVDGNSEMEKDTAIRKAIKNLACGWFFRASGTDFKKIPGSPIAYWASNNFFELFSNSHKLSEYVDIKFGMRTGDNDRFLRQWFEVSRKRIGFSYRTMNDFTGQSMKWMPYAKGGNYRKWFGNHDYVVNWENEGQEVKENTTINYPDIDNVIEWKITNEKDYLKEGITWSRISSSYFGVRKLPEGFIFSDAACGAFPLINYSDSMGLLCSKVSSTALSFINPTLTYQVGDIKQIPYVPLSSKQSIETDRYVKQLIHGSQDDWDSYETAWDFTDLPLLNIDYRQSKLENTFQNIRTFWKEKILKMQNFEEENNRIFIDAYGLQDELTPEVPLKEITLTCNPHYRYGGNKTETELEVLLLSDTMKEFISYAVGCMFGRYSLDKPGLILANQGETINDYLKQIPEPTFLADDDNVIPILDDNWFTDDIAERFQRFLRVTFGDEHYEANLKFIEKAIGKSIRKYFLKDFYTDHVKRYKKRPIYWLFSSPKGNFNALIYMHRYRPDTVSVILNDYLREFRTKLIARKEHLEKVSISATADNREKTTALKEIEKLTKIIDELNDYENDILYPLATQNIEIDLDDGVKTNYPKFGNALKKIPGIS
jgi:type II restriction/modification system DNA methylase subunit YeeA